MRKSGPCHMFCSMFFARTWNTFYPLQERLKGQVFHVYHVLFEYTARWEKKGERKNIMDHDSRPAGIPPWAINVRKLDGGNFWMWEFSGGAHVYLGWAGSDGAICQDLSLPADVLASLLADFDSHRARYQQAIADDIANRRAYDTYIGYDSTQED